TQSVGGKPHLHPHGRKKRGGPARGQTPPRGGGSAHDRDLFAVHPQQNLGLGDLLVGDRLGVDGVATQVDDLAQVLGLDPDHAARGAQGEAADLAVLAACGQDRAAATAAVDHLHGHAGAGGLVGGEQEGGGGGG